tara:strand:+ start:2953 stop:3714 length:762 start_codon:yes stop_codon:yes gene_type:complete
MKKNNKKVAWITGGGTGIGKELAKVLVKNKWNVVISGRRIDKLNQVKNFGKNNITSFKLDISSSTQCQKIVKKIFTKFGKIDLAILNAAAYNPGNLEFSELKKIKNVIDVNLTGQINCLSYIVPYMKKEKSGQIVFISSPAGFRGLPNAGIYGVTKSALTFLAESTHIELLKSKIKIQVVHPGFIKTPMTDKNKFPMPFLMSSEEAAQKIFNKLKSPEFEISFPKKLIIPMKILQIIPYKLYFFLMKNFVKLI